MNLGHRTLREISLAVKRAAQDPRELPNAAPLHLVLGACHFRLSARKNEINKSSILHGTNFYPTAYGLVPHSAVGTRLGSAMSLANRRGSRGCETGLKLQ